MENLVYYLPILAVLGFLFIGWKSAWVKKQQPGTEKMQKIASHIREGAMAFLKAEYKYLVIFVLAVAALLYFKSTTEANSNGFVVVSFITGALFSGLAGFIGLSIATRANVRTTHAARSSLKKALAIAFSGGSVMGIGVVSLGVFGLSLLFVIFNYVIGVEWDLAMVLNVISSFSLGASSIALFARVGGGIYTKAADVGADLVGKVEAGIPEDHPLNPATIADNVGDNVGDVAGMGADLFESFVGSIIATMVLGASFVILPPFQEGFTLGPVILPMALAGLGIVTSVIGTFFVRVSDKGDPQKALNKGEFISMGIMVVVSYFLIDWFLPQSWTSDAVMGAERTFTSLNIFGATLVGLAIGLAIGKITEYYTSTGTRPVKGIVNKSMTGPATNIIGGLELGMKSTALPVLGLAIAIIISYSVAGLYGIAIAAVAMLSNMGIQLAIDAYGPIADNAGGIAEMNELPPDVRKKTDQLDAVGNTTAAIGKGFAIASATLTALALFSAFMTQANIENIDIAQPKIMAGLLVGGMLPFLFSSMALGAVGRASTSMIEEVRKQFSSIPKLTEALKVLKKYNGDTSSVTEEEQKTLDDAEGSAKYQECVKISTESSLREMVLPGTLAVVAPALVGYLGGAQMLGGLLAGVVVSGVLLAIFQANSGGAWDNAKKMIEEGYEYKGELHEKGGDAHKATVVGDTVGDPFKDTSGPSLNILIKLMSVVALVIAPGIAMDSGSDEQAASDKQTEKEIKIDKPQEAALSEKTYRME
ncbi:MAG: sodium-translocating pyrophosphatase [Bacteroidales bacterium]|nr:sodium-translocating pyrophosphatase [Bacteroidales bacterium]MCF8334196.1 sodium-translocating pyrophosphatase [Bacteroidales bacterium]